MHHAHDNPNTTIFSMVSSLRSQTSSTNEEHCSTDLQGHGNTQGLHSWLRSRFGTSWRRLFPQKWLHRQCQQLQARQAQGLHSESPAEFAASPSCTGRGILLQGLHLRGKNGQIQQPQRPIQLPLDRDMSRIMSRVQQGLTISSANISTPLTSNVFTVLMSAMVFTPIQKNIIDCICS